MRANRAYELITSREGPPLLASDDDPERIEVVSIDDGEVTLFWELPHRFASRVLKELRADLVTLSAEDFLEKWQGVDVALEE
jgi:hypothetical protein